MSSSPVNLQSLSPLELLCLHGDISEELKARGVTRTMNNPIGDFAEHLFCRAFGWVQQANSKAGYDAICPAGVRYQIKGRRITRDNGSRQLGAIRKLEDGHFDFLAGVLFNRDFDVLRAAIIPPAIVLLRAKRVEHTNSHKFLLHDDVWGEPGVRDVTAELCSALETI